MTNESTPPGKSRFSYIFREKDCGHATIAIVDEPRAMADSANEIARALKDGMIMERVEVEQARVIIGEGFDFMHDRIRGCKPRCPTCKGSGTVTA